MTDKRIHELAETFRQQWPNSTILSKTKLAFITEIVKTAYTEGRREMREEAAEICDEKEKIMKAKPRLNDHYDAMDCANQIRELKD